MQRNGIRRKFDREASQRLKGVAIIMMVFHHCFLADKVFAGYDVSFWPFQQYQVVNIAAMMKLVVPIYAFVSGVGLWTSYHKSAGDAAPGRWTLLRYIKTFSGFLVCMGAVGGNYAAD